MRTLLNNPVALTIIIVALVVLIFTIVAIVFMVKRRNLPENVHKRKVAEMEKEEEAEKQNKINNIASSATVEKKKEVDPDAIKVRRARKDKKINTVINTVSKKK